MQVIANSNIIVQFMQTIRSNITDGQLKMSDIKPELVDIAVETFEEHYFFKIERDIKPEFIGGESSRVIEIWQMSKEIDLDNGQENVSAVMIEQTPI